MTLPSPSASAGPASPDTRKWLKNEPLIESDSCACSLAALAVQNTTPSAASVSPSAIGNGAATWPPLTRVSAPERHASTTSKRNAAGEPRTSCSSWAQREVRRAEVQRLGVGVARVVDDEHRLGLDASRIRSLSEISAARGFGIAAAEHDDSPGANPPRSTSVARTDRRRAPHSAAAARRDRRCRCRPRARSASPRRPSSRRSDTGRQRSIIATLARSDRSCTCRRMRRVEGPRAEHAGDGLAAGASSSIDIGSTLLAARDDLAQATYTCACRASSPIAANHAGARSSCNSSIRSPGIALLARRAAADHAPCAT